MRKNNGLKKLLTGLCLLPALLFSGCTQEMAPVEGIDAAAWAGALSNAALTVGTDLADNYAAYFTPEEFQLMLDDYDGKFAGVGVYMDQDETGRVRVASLMPGRPAQDAGVEAGDFILAVDGESVAGLDLNAVASRLRGEEGVGVAVSLLREREDGDFYYDVTIVRAIIESDSLEGQFLSNHPGIAYIFLYNFTERTPLEFYDLLIKLDSEQEIRGLILDLRGNGGGSFGAAISIAGMFVPKGEPIVWEKTYGGERCHRSADGALRDLPVVCLQDGYTASAAETLIGALMDYDIASVVGGVSYGKGITQILDYLPDGGGIRYTQSRYYTPQKFDLHGKGIKPQTEIEMPEDTTYAEYFDPYNEHNLYMQSALEILERRIDMSIL